MSTDQVDLICPIYNRDEYTSVFLDSLYEVDHGMRINPIIVDNGSRRRTSSVISGWVDRYVPSESVGRPVVLANDKNLGFSGGVNVAMRHLKDSRNDVIIIHNDTYPFDGWALEMSKALDSEYNDVAAVMPRTNYANENGVCVKSIRERFESIKPSNKERMSSESVRKLIDETYPYGKDEVVSALRDEFEMDVSYSSEIASFCVMVSREAIDVRGEFDEEFFPRGYEDKWWFLPLERESWICNIANRAYVHHFGNITSDGPGFSFPVEMERNRVVFERKLSEMVKHDQRDM